MVLDGGFHGPQEIKQALRLVGALLTARGNQYNHD